MGKITHFRKHGIAVPINSAFEDLKRLQLLLNSFDIDHCVFLGDLFHSDLNQFWFEFVKCIAPYTHIQFILVKGNHDIMDNKIYEEARLKVLNEILFGNILFTHEKSTQSEHYNIYGHLHPGVVLKGKARQSLRLPCFFFGDREGILPAFGSFTGLFIIEPNKKDMIYILVNQKIIKWSDNSQ